MSGFSQTPASGTYFLAPDVHMGPQPVWTRACDVYSFGLLMFEATHRQVAYGAYPSGLAALAAACGGSRPALAGPPRELGVLGGWASEMMARCWQPDHAARPSMGAVLEQLTSVDVPEGECAPWRLAGDSEGGRPMASGSNPSWMGSGSSGSPTAVSSHWTAKDGGLGDGRGGDARVVPYSSTGEATSHLVW